MVGTAVTRPDWNQSVKHAHLVLKGFKCETNW